jgi:hypothetical protein
MGQKLQKTKVIQVVDGDTVVIANGEKVRYIGVDAPEMGIPFFVEATRENQKLVEGKEILLEKDVSEKDRYGRLLRYVYLKSKMVNRELVRGGWARAKFTSPNIKYHDELMEAEEEARKKHRGMWKEEKDFSRKLSALSWVIWIIALVALFSLFYYAGWEVDLFALLGMGAIPLVLGIGFIIWILDKNKLYLLWGRWNLFLGGVALFFFLIGMLGFFSFGNLDSLGGEVGRVITGQVDVWAVLYSLGLGALGITLTFPHFVKRVVIYLTNFCRYHPVHRSLKSKATSFFFRKVPLSDTETNLSPEGKRGMAFPLSIKGIPLMNEGKSLRWKLPSWNLLKMPSELEGTGDEVEQKAKVIEEALASYGVEARVVQINVGPAVTQFGVEPGWERKYKEVRDPNGILHQAEVSRTRVKVERITQLQNDLALALAAPSIRIEAPVPGKSIIGIEVPNSTMGVVTLRRVMETEAFQKRLSQSSLTLALGEAASGEVIVGDLATMPHLLIAGATGSGKTVCILSIIVCLLLHNTPDDLKLILIDPKKVELSLFEGIPHLKHEVIVDKKKTVEVLRWLNLEMDDRYQKMTQAKARNIEGYNEISPSKIPQIILVIDELADLMMSFSQEVEPSICRLAQLSRATGIHLIVATQRPSVDVITGLIKANFPTRISFAVTSQADSRTILDSGGAEKLLGRGDMLYLPPDVSKPKRLQGCLVTDAEIQSVATFWREQVDEVHIPTSISLPKEVKKEEDELLEAARQACQEYRKISTSLLQRKLRIGRTKAEELLQKLKEEGYNTSLE